MPLTKKQMTQELFDEIVDKVHAELMEAPEDHRDAFLLAEWTDDKLIDYHSSLGRHIRNNYELWTYEWEPDLRDGVDYSKFHPDNVSMEIIKKVWERGYGRSV